MSFEKLVNRYIPMTETMFYILLSLREERHGYAIMQHVRRLTEERLILGAGTVYSSLGKLEGDGLIEAVKNDGRRKTYLITSEGLQILRCEAVRIRELHRNIEGIL